MSPFSLFLAVLPGRADLLLKGSLLFPSVMPDAYQGRKAFALLRTAPAVPFIGRGACLQETGMTTSKETEWMNHPRLRKLVTAVNELTLAERLTLVKGLVPAIAEELSDTEYEKFVASIRLKGERFHEAQAHPGEGRAERKIPGERDVEGR